MDGKVTIFFMSVQLLLKYRTRRKFKGLAVWPLTTFKACQISSVSVLSFLLSLMVILFSQAGGIKSARRHAETQNLR